MSVKVVFEFTHTEDGIDVKHEVVDGGKGGCVCEVAFAGTTITTVRSAVAKINRELKADIGFTRFASGGGVH
ncbi:hypothetical protein B2O45_01725 [Salmonella enterica]|uniref:Uncharacterized protein n=1 Tax=Salmonella enterica TaxID=28901 RepID=A0A5U7RGL9_SALER|nr:hypothetical protein [Salmonella enterica]EHW6435895.1 hypothetical protein [Salmonella enterica]